MESNQNIDHTTQHKIKKTLDFTYNEELVKSLLDLVDKECLDTSECFHEEQQIILYDFRRPNILSRTHLKNIHSMMNKVNSQFINELKMGYLINEQDKEEVELVVHAIDQLTYEEYLMNFDEETFKEERKFNHFVFSMYANKGLFEIAFEKHIQEKSDSILNNHFKYKQSIELLEDLLTKNIPFETNINKLFNNNQKRVNSIMDNEVVCYIVMELIIGNQSGMIFISIPISFNEPFFQNFKGAIA